MRRQEIGAGPVCGDGVGWPCGDGVGWPFGDEVGSACGDDHGPRRVDDVGPRLRRDPPGGSGNAMWFSFELRTIAPASRVSSVAPPSGFMSFEDRTIREVRE
jgi:hypothetical protein